MLLLTNCLKPKCKDTIKEEKNDCNDKTEYWPTSIKESLNWLPYLHIMDFTSESIENNINFYRNC